MNKSPLLEEEKDLVFETPDYTDEEILYLKNLRAKIVIARNKKEQGFKEFDGMTFTQYWNKCEELANTTIEPRKNKDDISYKSGTLRQKLFAVLSTIVGLNLEPDISTYTADNIIIGQIGKALETIIWKTREIDKDEEKLILRLYELVVRGFVFVEELWEDQYITEKPRVKEFSGKFKSVDTTPRRVKVMSKATRNIIPSLSIVLGDLSKYEISDQPFIYTVTTERYDVLEKQYKNFEMWKYVGRKVKNFEQTVSDSTGGSALWYLTEGEEDICEVIKYQDKPNKEYQVIINGIPMLPIGFGFPWGYDEYNIVQQNLKPIRHNFAYGKSFLFENKNLAELIDSFTRYNLLKTLKSIFPAYLNMSQKVIDNSVLRPGNIAMGIPPGALQPIAQKESDGVTQSEFMMLEGLIKNLDQNTVSQTFTGQQERKTGITATQILEIQKQSKIMLGIIITCCSLLEQKLTTLRLFNVLQNWFEDNVTSAQEALEGKYKVVMKEGLIPGEGEGDTMIIPVDFDMPDEESVYAQEMERSFNKGRPARIIYLNPKKLKAAKLLWVIKVNPREKKTSELSKIMFGQMVREAIEIGLQPNMKYIAERFAQVWEEDPGKMFENAQQPQTDEQLNQGQQAGIANPDAMANIEPQTPTKPQPPMPNLTE